MSEMEKAELHEINEGEPKQGIEWLVPMLQRHMKESKDSFKNFKRDVALEYVNEINSINERLKPIEVSHKDRHKNLGIAGGVGVVIGFLFSFAKDIYSFFFRMTPDQKDTIIHFTKLCRASWFRKLRFLKSVYPELTMSVYLKIIKE